MKATRSVRWGATVTFWNAASRLIGRCAEAGSNGVVTYSCGTVSPAAEPWFVTSAVTCSVPFASAVCRSTRRWE